MRMMVVFEKGAALRHIGHLDLMRTMQRALRRSGLPIKYSNGFNPHIRLSFAAPLSVGVVGLRELMEVPVEDGTTEESFVQRMNEALPDCLRICACRAVDDGFPALMSLVAGSFYRIALPDIPQSAQVVAALDGFMALEEYVAVRRTKSGENPCDIRAFVTKAAAQKTPQGYEIVLSTVVTQAGSLKPSLWMDCLCEYAGVEPFRRLIYRTAILARNASGELVPMEEI